MVEKRTSLTKSQWNERYEILNRAHSDFILEYPRSKNGKNAEVRTNAQRQVDRAINTSRMLIEGDSDMSAFLTSSEYGTGYRQDEFFQARHYGSDMGGFLTDLRKYIDSLPDDPLPQGIT